MASFQLFKKAGCHEKGAGHRALQKTPRQNTPLDVKVYLLLYLVLIRNLVKNP